MISSGPSGASGTVRLLLLTVLLGLFGMHVLTAHGADHHGVATVVSAASGHLGAGHGAGSPDAAAGGMTMDGSHAIGTPVDPPSAAGSTAVPVLAGVSAAATPGAPSDGAGLLACWLMITAGVALIALVLRGRGVGDIGGRAPLSIVDARPGRPRAPPARVRLRELTVLRV